MIKMSKNKVVKSLILVSAVGVVAAGCTISAKDSPIVDNTPPATINKTSGAVTFKDAKGGYHGDATFTPEGGKLKVFIKVVGLTPGFHGVHIHKIGICTPDQDPAKNFLSAGGHYQAPGHTGDPMSGDLPNVFVNKDGEGEETFITDAFTMNDLNQKEGTSIVVHALASNFANIPASRYVAIGGGKVPDQKTLDTYDAGDRVLCGVIAAPESQ